MYYDPPSPFRIPVTVVLALIAPPLALVAWIMLSGAMRGVFLRSPWVRAGGLVILVGALPLIGIILASALGLWPDPNPNPVGLGLLFFAAGIVGCLLALFGVIWATMQAGRE